MNILFISYDSYKYDGRLRELIKVADSTFCIRVPDI